ncbi:MAG: inositol monophosphatase family protein [Vulcanimicrobiota bacterium]
MGRQDDKHLDAACRAARLAGQRIRADFGQAVVAGTKGPKDLYTETDLACEKLLYDALTQEFPDYGFLGEEGGRRGAPSPAPCWVVDPLDGTTNFTHGYPLVAVTVALLAGGTCQVGVVYDPLRDELFTGARGRPSRLNGQPIKVSHRRRLEEALLITGFAGGERQVALISAMQRATHGIRRDGCAALDICFVACGRADGFWDWQLASWDMAAAALIVEGAEGTVTNLTGGSLELTGGQVLASNTYLHKEMTETIANHL